MAKKGESTFHGWTIEHGQRPDGKPTVTLSKPGRNAVTTIGRRDADAEIMLQRARVYALEQDVDQAAPEERRGALERLHAARTERDVARAVRVATAAAQENARIAAEAELAGESA